MQFRPCIDIHNGKVKQIVGSSLSDNGDTAKENFVSDRDSTYFAKLYKSLGLAGGHVIILNSRDSEYYEASYEQAMAAFAAYPGGLMAGGGINADNAGDFLDAGASHVIVTSFVFSGGRINNGNLEKLEAAVGAGHIVLDLSCKRTPEGYFVATDRWQNLTDVRVDEALFDSLSKHCDEFLVHAIDLEGKAAGPDEELIGMLGRVSASVTYAGGIASLDDISKIKSIGRSKVNITVGSKLDIFGGNLRIEEIIECTR